MTHAVSNDAEAGNLSSQCDSTGDLSAEHKDFEDDRRSLLILYATETGNALDAAEQIARSAQRRHFKMRIASTDAYPLEDLIHEHLILFVISTTGSGSEPRSMTDLWTLLLRSDLPKDLFEGLDFAVFGLGDTAYEKFCWAAKKLARRMESLGAREVYLRGEGDEQDRLGTDGTLDKWINGLFRVLDDIYPQGTSSSASNNGMEGDDGIFPPRIESISHDQDKPYAQSSSSSSTVDTGSSYHMATVRRNDRITDPTWYQDVRHMEFDFEDDIIYEPGDLAVIHPIASSDDVESFLVSMNWANLADVRFSFVPNLESLPLPHNIPRTTTLRELFTYYLDINAVPRRSFFKLLRYFTNDELEREKLDEFCSDEGADDLYEYCHRVRRTIREVMTEFRTVDVPKEYIFDLFPTLRPRQFSIASSVKVYPKQIHLCVAIVRYRTKLKVPRRGVCTTYLASLLPGDKLHVGIQKGFMSLPRDKSAPVICIGPGTGVAPMRALLGERIHHGHRENTLYFGCRSAMKDHHYANEWSRYANTADLVYRTAFSRDGLEGVQRTYVQDRLSEDQQRIWDLIERQGAYVYISGSANKMPAGVKGVLEDAARHIGGLNEEEAKEYVRTLQVQGRLVEECWS